MEIKDLLKKHAIEYAAKNTIAQYGEVVETLWGDWENPHKVKIDKIGAALVSQSWYSGSAHSGQKPHLPQISQQNDRVPSQSPLYSWRHTTQHRLSSVFLVIGLLLPGSPSWASSNDMTHD